MKMQVRSIKLLPENMQALTEHAKDSGMTFNELVNLVLQQYAVREGVQWVENKNQWGDPQRFQKPNLTTLVEHLDSLSPEAHDTFLDSLDID